jgi:1-acyl-sn-glycerol-3-phosphate acyltransferase
VILERITENWENRNELRLGCRLLYARPSPLFTIGAMYWQGLLIGIGVVAAALALWAIVAWRRTYYNLSQAFLYFINVLITSVMWRVKVCGSLPVKPGQPAVIVSNHISGIDPLIIQRTTNCCVHWMVAKEYVDHPAMAWAFRILQVIPVNRGGVDTAATKQAIRLLQNGEPVGMFLEGRINTKTNETLLLPGRPGAAWVALRARVPVIPCYVEGAPYNGTALGSFLMRARARVVVGKPIDIFEHYDQADDREVQEALTLRFLKAIAKLAGHDEFEPKLAGRHWKSDQEVA